jgi:pimeloyl-ACP methyl ester carboxylesterase
MTHAHASLAVPANGLTHHVLEWPGNGRSQPASASLHATVLLLHGYMDAAATWDLVASQLAAEGLRVLAPDLRGFGDAPRAAPGGYYHFPNYVFDVADIVDGLVPADSPLFVVGHSMGGTIATLYAGTFPARLKRLALLEGAGPPNNTHDVGPDRMSRWVREVRMARARGERVMASREEALGRLAANHPRVPQEVLRTCLDALARPLPEGRMIWKADTLHGTGAPMPFFAESWMAFARRVTCPVLFVSGGPLGWHPSDEDARVKAFATLERAEIADAGHMMHWTRPTELARLLVDFCHERSPG